MTLNTVKPRSAIRRLSPSMVCGTDLLLGLVMTPSEDCVLSSIRPPSGSEAQVCPAARTGRCLILVHQSVARQRRTLHPPSGGPTSAVPGERRFVYGRRHAYRRQRGTSSGRNGRGMRGRGTEGGEGVGHYQRTRHELVQGGGAAAGGGGRRGAGGRLDHPAAGEDPLQVRRRD